MQTKSTNNLMTFFGLENMTRKEVRHCRLFDGGSSSRIFLNERSMPLFTFRMIFRTFKRLIDSEFRSVAQSIYRRNDRKKIRINRNTSFGYENRNILYRTLSAAVSNTYATIFIQINQCCIAHNVYNEMIKELEIRRTQHNRIPAEIMRVVVNYDLLSRNDIEIFLHGLRYNNNKKYYNK